IGSISVKKHNLMPLLVGVFGIIIVVAMGLSYRHDENASVRLETNITAEQVRLRLESCVDARVALATAVADPSWNDSRTVIDEWPGRVAALFPILPGIQALNYIDNDWVIRQVYPEESNRSALNKDLHDHISPSVTEALGAAEVSTGVVRTEPVDLLQAGKGIVLYYKFRSEDGTPLGYVNVVFRLQTLMNTCLYEENIRDRFRYHITERDGSVAYWQGDESVDDHWSGKAVLPVRAVDKTWQLHFAMTPAYLASHRSGISMVMIAAGAVLVIILSLVLRALMQRRIALKESQKKYRMLVEHQSDFVANLSVDGKFLYASPSLCRFIGKPESEVVGHAVADFVHDTDKYLLPAIIQKVKEPPYQTYVEFRGLSHLGPRWTAWACSAVIGSDGRIESVMTAGRDVTDLKRLEEQLSRSRKMDLMGRMAGGITHDFNNLLHVILGNLEIVTDDADEGFQRPLHSIKVSVERAIRLTEQLGKLSHQADFKPAVVELNEFVADVATRVRAIMPAGIRIETLPAAQDVSALADIEQLEQVILNLCINARDAIGETGLITIETSLAVLDSHWLTQHPDLIQSEYACIRVQDNGAGIHPDIFGKIFDPFFTTKKKGEGSGLGLANCYGIIRQHHGLILADSVPGEGATFTVYLPLAEHSVNYHEAPAESVVSRGALQNRTVLLVDDEPEILQIFSTILQREGVEVLTASDGEEAVSIVSAAPTRIDLVVLDIVMPVMDGRTAGIEIARINPDIIQIFATGYDPEGTLMDNLSRDAIVLRKPFRPAEFVEMLSSALAK
ncbi:MAG: response regulator, partial [Pseudomonadales bacterium]|nr:response regulator [Pseudomonadales bacterium]